MRGLILYDIKSQSVPISQSKYILPSVDRVQKAFDKMSALDIPVVVSVNEAQYKQCTGIFTDSQLVKDDATIHTSGPLLALLSTHNRYKADDLFLLDSDMCGMETWLLEQLLSDYKKQTADAYVFSHGYNYEPLCGIYTAGALKKINRLFKNNRLPDQHLASILKQVNTFAVPIPSDQEKYFRHCGDETDSPQPL